MEKKLNFKEYLSVRCCFNCLEYWTKFAFLEYFLEEGKFPDFDSYNLKTLIYQGIEVLLFCLLHYSFTENKLGNLYP